MVFLITTCAACAKPLAQRVLGESHDTTFTMRWVYAEALCKDEGATVNDLREGVETLEDTERTARRVFGGAHPLVVDFERTLRESRAALGAREVDVSAIREAVAATTLGDA